MLSFAVALLGAYMNIVLKQNIKPGYYDKWIDDVC
jgi:ABC-type transporter Mla maintaining outer membrane lipid asymmetry permease subunit MlaE